MKTENAWKERGDRSLFSAVNSQSDSAKFILKDQCISKSEGYKNTVIIGRIPFGVPLDRAEPTDTRVIEMYLLIMQITLA